MPRAGVLMGLGSALLMACGPSLSSPRPAPTVDTTPVVDEAPAAGDSDAAMDDEPEPARTPDKSGPWYGFEGAPPVEAPENVICTLPRGKPTVPLVGRLRPGGAEVFHAQGLEITLSLVAGHGLGSGFFEGKRDGLAVRAASNRADLRLFARERLILGGFVAPRHNARLTVHGIEPKGVTIGIDPQDLDDLELKVELRRRVGCSALSVAQGKPREPFTLLPDGFPARTGWGDLHASSFVPLSLEPGQAPVAHLTEKRNAGVAVFDQRAGFTRVAVPHRMVVVFGWVPASMVKPRPTEVDDGLSGYGFGSGGGSSSTRPLKCPHPVLLAAELGDERKAVALADPGVLLIPMGERSDGTTEVWLRRKYWFRTGKDVDLLVATSSLEGCERVDE